MTIKDNPVMQDDEAQAGCFIRTFQELGTADRGSAFSAPIGLILKLLAGGPELVGHDQ